MAWQDDLVAYATGQIDDRVREALWTRGVSDEQISLFQVGYLDRQLPDLQGPGVAPFMSWARGGSRLEDMVVFPLTDFIGGIRGFQFRPVARENHHFSDYIVDPAGPDFFGAAQAAQSIWETEQVHLVEGPYDLFPIQRQKPNVLATLTARVSDPGIRTFRRHVREMVFLYDNDGPGRLGVSDFAKWHGKEFRVVDKCPPKVRMLTGKLAKDVGDLWETYGDPGIVEFLSRDAWAPPSVSV